MSNDENRSKAKADVEQLLGKSEKKKKKSAKLDPPVTVSSPGKGGSSTPGALPGIERKPLPGIKGLVSEYIA